MKVANFSDKLARKLFVLEAIDLGAKPSHLASALKISRQTIHNYIETRKHFGLEGLIHSYNPNVSKNLEKQRKSHANERTLGNKAELVAEIRAQEKEKTKEQTAQQSFNFSFEENDSATKISPENQPFAETHDWESNRYVGLFIYWLPLICNWKWLHLVMGHYRSGWKIFSVFLLMAGGNIRSIEQLKNVSSQEAGRICGLGRLPSRTTI